MKILVNGRETETYAGFISYEDILKLANKWFGAVLLVVYDSSNGSGHLRNGETVRVTDGMVFNVSEKK